MLFFMAESFLKAVLLQIQRGNISIFKRDKLLFAIKPSGMEYFDITPNDVVILNLKGEVVDGKRKSSNEVNMHRVFYERRKDINAIVHSHSLNVTILSCLNEPLRAIHYLIAFSGSDFVDYTPYVLFGSHELAEVAFKYIGNKYAVLLRNHGIVTGGADTAYTYSTFEELEFCCEFYFKTKALGRGKILNKEDIDIVLKKFSTYG